MINIYKIEKWKYWGVIGLFLSIILIAWLTYYGLILRGHSWNIDFKFLIIFSTTLGGFSTFLSVLLLYATLSKQTASSRLMQIENKYFSQIQYHRDNVKQMQYRIPSKIIIEETPDGNKSKIIIENGGRVFIEIHRQILKAIKIVENELLNNTVEDIYENCSLIEIKKELNSGLSTDDKLKRLAIIDFAYLSVFFGLSKQQGRKALEKILAKNYKPVIIEKIINKLKKEIAEYDKVSKKGKTWQERVNNDWHFKYFGGHQHRLGHYFRHIFQTITYINNQPNLDYKEKYNYIKTLRAQLSTYEQSVIFFNSLSQLGRVWELILDNEDVNYKLATKYNFFKNIPSEFIDDYQPIEFYPNIHYEGSNIPKDRKKLMKKYK